MLYFRQNKWRGGMLSHHIPSPPPNFDRWIATIDF